MDIFREDPASLGSRETLQHARAGGKLRFGIKALRQCFILGGGSDFYETICGQLIDLGMQETKLFAGENLTLEDEQIFTSTPEEIKGRKAPSLAVLYAEWTGPRRPLSHGISDEAFTRGKVPMIRRVKSAPCPWQSWNSRKIPFSTMSEPEQDPSLWSAQAFPIR